MYKINILIPTWRPGNGGGLSKSLRRFLARMVMGLAVVAPATAASTLNISNTATLSFSSVGVPQLVASNTVSLTREGGLPASVHFMRFPANTNFKLPTARCNDGRLSFAEHGNDGARVPNPASYQDTASYAANAPVLIELINPSGNIDPATIDSSLVVVRSGRGDVEHLTLFETGTDTGVFTGTIDMKVVSPVPESCALEIDAREKITVDFDGAAEGTNDASDTALIDPFGYVFDSLTGALVDGATVSLVDAETGQLARVFGDDGISAYPSTVVSGQAVTDAGGAVYPGRAGSYRFPMAAPGSYRIQVSPPAGYGAPSTVMPDQLSTLEGPQGAYLVADASYGRAFALTQMEPLQVDIPVDPAGGQLTLDKRASTRTASPGDMIQYRLRLANRDGSTVIPGVTITDVLPPGLRYRRGSTRGVAEPEVSKDGRNLIFHPGIMTPGSSLEIRYGVMVAPGAPIGEALNRAVAVDASGARSAAGSAAVRIRALLNTDAMTIVGRVVEGTCGVDGAKRKGVPNVRILLEDGTYVLTDGEGLYHFEGVRRGRHVVQLDIQGLKAGYSPIECDADTRSAGRALSRFVEGQGGTMQRVDFILLRDPAAVEAATSKPAAEDIVGDAAAAGNGIDWLDWAGDQPGPDWLFPAIDYNPRAPVLRVIIKHVPGQAIQLTLNGTPVDELLRDQGDGNGKVAIAKWTGLPLREGDNRIEARILDPSGTTAKVLTRTVHYANTVSRVDYVAERSNLVADGVSRPAIAVRLLDRDGRPVRKGTPISFQVDDPYEAAIEVKAQNDRPLQGLGRSAPTAYVAGDDGIALIELEPTGQAGAARLTLSFSEDGKIRTQDVRPWLQAAAREWIVVGFGAGTVGHEILSGKARKAGMLSRHDSFTDGQIAFYAKGRIKGSWLLTMAYDSSRKRDEDRGLQSTIDPDRYYTVYGDGTTQGYDAASSGKLYLRLERRQFYALYGDFRTELTQAQLTRYSRTLNGLKGEFRGRLLSFSGFAAKSDERHLRQELQGSGLTGPYRLRGRAIVPNSEQVRIETRDRLRSELIVDTRDLSRHIDYDIDSDNGTLVFKSPVLPRDGDGNPIFIVVDYEIYGGGAKQLAVGGRVATSLFDDKVEAGATLLRDETSGTATVGGIDIKARVIRNTELRLEAALGGTRGGTGERAYLAEVEHHDARIDLLAYVRQQDQDFGVNQLNVVEAGTRKYGADARGRINSRLSITVAAWHQEALLGPARRNAIDTRAEWRSGETSFHAGFKMANDIGVANIATRSKLLMLGGSRELFNGKLLVAAENQFALGQQRGSVDFPVRRTIDVGYQLADGIRLIGGYQAASGDRYSARAIRGGLDVAPWAGGKVSTTINQETVGENGPRSFAQFGMSQALPIGKAWTIDASFDASKTMRGSIPSATSVNPLHPTASFGSLSQDGNPDQDYSAVSLGLSWQSGQWSWNGRAERRRGDTIRRWGFSGNLLRRLGEGRTIGSSFRFYRIKQRDGGIASDLSADFAVAWRPLDSRWAILDRLEFRHQRGDARVGSGNVLGVVTANGVDALSTRIVHNLAVSWRDAPDGGDAHWEAAVYHGVKYVRGAFGDDRFDGLIDVIGFDLRRDLGRTFDVGIGGSVQHSWNEKIFAYSIGPSVGLSPAGNMWISVGYNVKGFHDRDFEDGRYLRQGPYVTLRLKFDQQTMSSIASRLGR